MLRSAKTGDSKSSWKVDKKAYGYLLYIQKIDKILGLGLEIARTCLLPQSIVCQVIIKSQRPQVFF